MPHATMEKQAATTPKKRKRRMGDRADGRLIRTLYPMNKFMPYIMRTRNDACNLFADSIDLTETDPYIRSKIKEGKVNFSFLHVFLAAYVRTVAKRPEINRFVSGNRIFARNNIVVNMTIKTTMSADAPDTCIKVYFEPTDTIDEVYEKFNAVVEEIKNQPDDKTSFDKLNKVLSLIPGLLCRWAVKFLNFLDYFGWLPKSLLWLSPFHGSMIITSMGSLGIRPIYHHIYNFGNLPTFLAYGTKRTELYLDAEGNVKKRKMVDLKAVTDERICDGFYYASAFKLIKKMVENPELLEIPPETVVEDID